MRNVMGRVAALTVGLLLVGRGLFGYETEVKTISAALADQIAQAGKKSVAVVDFTDLQGNVTELGRFLAEEFSVKLAGAGKGFEVIDRNNLKTILQEHKLQASGIIDPTTAKRLGQIAGVDALVTGSLTPFGDSVHVAVKILDTATAKVIGATSGDIPKTRAIEDLIGRGVGELAVGQSRAVQEGRPKAAAKGSLSADVEGFVFEVQGCLAEGSRLTCTVLVTNRLEDRTLLIGRPYNTSYDHVETRLIDQSGNTLGPPMISFGGRQDSDWVGSLLTSGVPTRLTLQFKDFPAASGKISLLELGAGVEVSHVPTKCDPIFRVQLREITVDRR